MSNPLQRASFVLFAALLALSPLPAQAEEAGNAASQHDALRSRGLLVVPVASCAAADALFAKAEHKNELVAVSACVKGSDGRQRRALDGATVYPGEEIVFAVRTARAAHVQILHEQHGVVAKLWPPDGEDERALIAPNQTLLVPDDDYRFVLDDDTGDISVFVIASSEPVRRVSPALYDAVLAASKQGGVRADHAVFEKVRPKPGPTKPAPPAAQKAPTSGAVPAPSAPAGESILQAPRPASRGNAIAQRGIVRERTDSGFVGAEPDPDGLVVIELRLKHVAKKAD